MGHDRILEEDAMVESHHSSDGLPGSVLSWFGDWGRILLSPERSWFFLISTRQQKTSKAVFPVS